MEDTKIDANVEPKIETNEQTNGWTQVEVEVAKTNGSTTTNGTTSKGTKNPRLYLKRMNTVGAANPHAFQEFSSDLLDTERRRANAALAAASAHNAETRARPDTVSRQVTSVPAPAKDPMKIDELFVNGLPDWVKLRGHLLKEGRLERDAVMQLIEQVIPILKEEPNVLNLDAPFTVCGDIHGQYFDLVNLLDNAGDPSSTPYLFLGDYVDRGYFSCEVCFLLYSLKINFPKTFYLLRGNHESRAMTKSHNFKVECLKKYGQEIYDKIMDSFDCLPLAAVVRSRYLGRFFCVHGGLSPSVKTLDDIHSINRFAEVPVEGSMCDLLWSDPLLEDEDMSSMDILEFREIDYIDNVERGIGHFFGFKAITEFLLKNNFVSLVRAHEVQQEGCAEHMFTRNDIAIPMAFTVFSAPNYCDFYSNKAAFIKFLHDKYEIYQLECVPHPYWLPDFQNVFSFSIEYVLDAVHTIMKGIASSPSSDDKDDDAPAATEDWQKESKSEYLQKLATLQNKIKSKNPAADPSVFDGLSPQERFKKAAEMDVRFERCSPVKKTKDPKKRQFRRYNSNVW